MFYFDTELFPVLVSVLVVRIVLFIKRNKNEGYEATVDNEVFYLYDLLTCILFVLTTKLLMMFDRLDVLICFIFDLVCHKGSLFGLLVNASR